METIAEYLIKSSVWLTGFALVYMLFLRNERFFTLNRIFLVAGMIASVCFPWFNFHYTVLLPLVPSTEVTEPQLAATGVIQEESIAQNLLLLAYLSGILYLVFRLLKQTVLVVRAIRKSGVSSHNNVRLVRTDRYPAPFSFFSFVFVNPSVNDTEVNEIVHHEQEHIRQRHWIDLLLFELLCILQWFNPMIWLYGRFIRQNHEYLADEFALRQTSNPAIYRAALLNQMFGGPVIQLANSFNYSLNKKRFNMMKQTISSPIRKLRLLLVFPLIAGVFYAFATPEYKFTKPEESSTNLTQNEKTIKGKVTDEKGNPLKSASVIISGKTIGTITDENGDFMLKVSDDSPIVVSYVGFETQKVTPAFEKEMIIRMKTAVIKISLRDNSAKSSDPLDATDNVLVIIDGKESTKAQMKKINPETIESVSVLKDESASALYGEKGKNGVVIVTSKKLQSAKTDPNKEVVVVGYGTNQKENSTNQPNSGIRIRSTGTNQKPVIVLNGKLNETLKVEDIDPETLKSVNILKGEEATKKYGEKGKNGIIEISTKTKEPLFTLVEEIPQFPGGSEAINPFVKENLQYPKKAIETGITGKVFVDFVISKTGKVENVEVAKGLHPLLDAEAVRVIKLMPDWKPGTQNGQNVEVKYQLPVYFQNPNFKQSEN